MKITKESKQARILKKAIGMALERPILRVWYEPLHEPCIEMQGQAGGWMYEEENGHRDCLGISFDEAIEFIILEARLHAKGII